MQRTGTNPKIAHRQIQSSTTLNRKYVRRPISPNAVRIRINEAKSAAEPAPAPKLSAQELKERAIKRALASTINETTPAKKSFFKHPAKPFAKTTTKSAPTLVAKTTIKPVPTESKNQTLAHMATKTTTTDLPLKKARFGFGRILLALSCTAAAVFAIVYFTNLNMPDISLRVAAMQTGIEASYPSYVPRDFALSDILSKNGKITLNFKNNKTGGLFSLSEEKSSWDSGTLLKNYVLDAFEGEHATIREQGLTIYVKNGNAAWVNGGIVYKLTSDSLTKKQIISIATSL